MKIVYDETKRRANLAKHGFDFATLDLDFFVEALIAPAKGKRLIASGKLDEATITVVFEPLGSEAIAIISMRHASRKERTGL